MNLTFSSKRQESNDVTTYIFNSPNPVQWQAGQFIEYQLPHEAADDRGPSRYFTISSAPHENVVQITTRLAGQEGSTFKLALDRLEAGQAIEASEPMGEFVIEDATASYVFIAGGIGITPFRSILLDLAHKQQPVNIILLYANRNDEFVFKPELDSLSSQFENFRVQYFADPQKIELKDIQQAATDLGADDVHYYISGPKPMVGHFRKELRESGVEKSQIKTDYFPGYDN